MATKDQSPSRDTSTTNGVTALLLTTPGCTHCAALKKILDSLLKDGVLETLNVVDVTKQPELANRYNVKSVPWLKLGDFQFQGSMTEKELRQWISLVNSRKGDTRYLKYLLENGELNQVIDLIRDHSQSIGDLLPLILDAEQDMKVRLGVSAVFEELQGSDILGATVEQLGELVGHENPQVRADIAHFLALTGDETAIPYLQRLARDTNPQVREIADEALTEPPDELS
ncbi:MAG: HEAT repeat domain-containing protein [Gammaproteobacteria bacterium]|jgi:hypothetical protein